MESSDIQKSQRLKESCDIQKNHAGFVYRMTFPELKTAELPAGPEAVIFDMDGVLVDSEIAWHEIEYERYSEIIPGWTLANHADLTGLSLRDSHRFFREKYGLEMTREEYLAFYDEAARDVYGNRCELIPGSIEILEELAEDGVPMGLASSSSHNWIGMVFRRFPLEKYFRCVVSADDVGGKGKPAPDVYLEAVRRMAGDMVGTGDVEKADEKNNSTGAGNYVAIEDSFNGLQAALRAGLYSIGFRNGNNDTADLSGAALELKGFGPENRDRIRSLFV